MLDAETAESKPAQSESAFTFKRQPAWLRKLHEDNS
jgi:hypothetical protein